MRETLSLIVPCYNEEESLTLFYREIDRIADQLLERFQLELEILFVDDGSSDRTLHLIKRLAAADTRVHYIALSRNFGKESAIYAGLQQCVGDFASVIDADLQHPPEMLIDMCAGILNEGYDCVAARRLSRKGEPRVRSFFSRCFYKFINRISNTKMVDGATDFCVMTRQMVDAILSMEEYNRFSKGLFSWVGFRTKWLPYENVSRAAGKTKWSFWKLLLYSMDGILSFSTAPLAVASVAGVALCFIAFILVCVIVLKTLLYGDPVAGFPTLICAICFIGGIQLFCLGIMGQYVARMYLEVKKRPIFVVREQKIGVSRSVGNWTAVRFERKINP